MAIRPASLHRVMTGEQDLSRDEFIAWGVGQGLSPEILATRWLVATFAERWLARHRLPLVAAQRSDIDAWCASAEGQILGEEGLEAIRTFIRYAEAMGYRGRKAAQVPVGDAQVLEMSAHRARQVG